MLFDLSSPGRKNIIRVVYAVLALLFLVGFVGFGIGGELGGGGIIDSLTGGGGGDTASQYEQQIEDAEEKLEADPSDEKALQELAYYRILSGSAQLERDEETGQPTGVTEEARSEFEAGFEAWERYLDTNPKKVDLQTASQIQQAYLVLQDAEGMADVQELVAKDDPSFLNYARLAFFRYQSLDLEAGDEAVKEAEALAKGSDKAQLKELERIREEAAKLKKQVEKQGELAPEENPLTDPLGGSPLAPPAP